MQYPRIKVRKPEPRTFPFRVADFLRTECDIAGYLAAVFNEENPYIVSRAMRNIAEAVGGVAELAKRTGLRRDVLARQMRESENPRYETIFYVLRAFGLRLSVARNRRPSRASLRDS